MVNALDLRSGGLSSSPDGGTALCSWARHSSLVVPLVIQVNNCIKLYGSEVQGLSGDLHCDQPALQTVKHHYGQQSLQPSHEPPYGVVQAALTLK